MAVVFSPWSIPPIDRAFLSPLCEGHLPPLFYLGRTEVSARYCGLPFGLARGVRNLLSAADLLTLSSGSQHCRGYLPERVWLARLGPEPRRGVELGSLMELLNSGIVRSVSQQIRHEQKYFTACTNNNTSVFL